MIQQYQPVDYSANAPQNPIGLFQQAYNFGSQIGKDQQANMLQIAQIEEMQAQRIAAEQAAAEEAKKKKAIDDAFKKATLEPTVDNYMALANMLPAEEAESVRKSFAMLDVETQQAQLIETGNVFAAFAAGKPEDAIRQLKLKLEGYKTVGNTAKAEELETWIKTAESGEVGAKMAEKYFGMGLSMMPGGDKVMETALNYAADIRTSELFGTLKEQKAVELAKAKSDADIRAVEAKYADKEKDLELQQMGKNLGLTDAQITELLARARHLDAQTAKIFFDMEAAKLNPNGLDDNARFEAEKGLNTQYNARTANFKEATRLSANVATSAAAAAETAAKVASKTVGVDPTAIGVADMALIFSFMKMLDPGSVVRESEYAQATQTAGLWDQVKIIASKFQTGDKLSESQRNMFVKLSKELMTGFAREEEKVRKDLTYIVEDYGLRPENVFGGAGISPTLQAKRAYLISLFPAEADKINSLKENELSLPGNYPKSMANFVESDL